MEGFREFLRLPEPGSVLFRFSGGLVEGKVIDRPNRFLVNVDINGERVPSHLHDPGRLKELIFPGNSVLVRETRGVKTSHSVTAALDNGEWILTDTRVHSEIASKFLPEDAVREVKVGNHRMDFRRGNTLIEVKGCTLLKGDIATFPDAPTRRGREHLELLRQHKMEGGDSVLMILAFRKNARCFLPNEETDPEFALEFRSAIRHGVGIFIPLLSFEAGSIVFHGETAVCAPRA